MEKNLRGESRLRLFNEAQILGGIVKEILIRLSDREAFGSLQGMKPFFMSEIFLDLIVAVKGFRLKMTELLMNGKLTKSVVHFGTKQLNLLIDVS